MPSLILYGVLAILIIYIIIRLVKWEKPSIQDAAVILGIVVSVIIAQKVPPPSWPPIFNQGKLVFDEDFNDGVANGIFVSNSKVEIINVDKTDKALQITNNSKTEWSGFELEDLTVSNGTIEYSINLADYDPSLGGSGAIACSFRSTSQHTYVFGIAPDIQRLSLNYQGVDTDYIWMPLVKGTSAYNLNPNTWHKIKIVFVTDRISIYFDEKQVLSSEDGRLKTGAITFGIAPNSIVLFDDLRIWERP